MSAAEKAAAPPHPAGTAPAAAAAAITCTRIFETKMTKYYKVY